MPVFYWEAKQVVYCLDHSGDGESTRRLLFIELFGQPVVIPRDRLKAR